MHYRPNGKLLSVATMFVAALPATQAFAWGSYGHEQINRAAAKLVSEPALQQCFERNLNTVTALAITPDYDWKVLGAMPTDPNLRRLKLAADKHEHPLHFFEADAYVTPGANAAADILKLPTESFRTVLPTLQKLLSANADVVAERDPEKKLKDPKHATAAEVASHGTAPWRAQQLYDLGVQAMAKGDYKKAVFYLGTMGHYIGDMSQAFHATLNYDGQYPKNLARGIHSVFESKILEIAAQKLKAKLDSSTKVWSNFDATEAQVLKLAKAEKSGAYKGLVPEVLSVVSATYPEVDQLVGIFADAKNKAPVTAEAHEEVAAAEPSHPGHAEHKSVPMAIVHEFGKKALPIAEVELARGTALLARVWGEAYRDALQKSAKSSGIEKCEAFTFTEKERLEAYPVPDYL